MRKHHLPVVLLFLAAARLRAEGDGTLSVTPAVVTLKGSHGQSTTQTMVLTNNTSRPFSFELIAEDVVIKDGQRTFVPAGEIAGSIAATAVFSTKNVHVNPGETAAVDVTFTLPPQATHRGVVAIFRGTTRIMNGRTPMTASIGTLMTFSIGDELALDAGPVTVTAQTSTKNLSIQELCTNNGSEPVVARGVAAIVDRNGALIGRIPLEPRRLFPSERTTIEGEYPGELPAGQYRVLVTYDLGGKSVSKSADVEVR